MTAAEELELEAHAIEASKLRNTSIGYKALVSLLKYGNVMSYAFKDYDVFVSFTRVLNHIQLQFEFVPFGLQLKQDAKITYRKNMMTYRPPEPVKQAYTESSKKRSKDDEREEGQDWSKKRFS